MEKSGAAEWLVGHVVGVLEPLPAMVVVGGFYLLTSLLTEVMSNNASAVVLTPVALAAAEGLGLSPYALLVAVMFGASGSFMTPVGYQTNAMIYGPGGYRYGDYLRVGFPLEPAPDGGGGGVDPRALEGVGMLQYLPPTYIFRTMDLPEEVRERFRKFGRSGGRRRAARLSPAERSAIARRAVTARWIRHRFGAATFGELGLPGGDMVDAGLADLACGRRTPESLAVSLAAPRLRREGVPVGPVLDDPERRLFELLSRTEGGLAHARYNAYLRQLVSFADACRLARIDGDAGAA